MSSPGRLVLSYGLNFDQWSAIAFALLFALVMQFSGGPLEHDMWTPPTSRACARVSVTKGCSGRRT